MKDRFANYVKEHDLDLENQEDANKLAEFMVSTIKTDMSRCVLVANTFNEFTEKLKKVRDLEMQTLEDLRNVKSYFEDIDYLMSLLIAQYEEFGFENDDRLY